MARIEKPPGPVRSIRSVHRSKKRWFVELSCGHELLFDRRPEVGSYVCTQCELEPSHQDVLASLAEDIDRGRVKLSAGLIRAYLLGGGKEIVEAQKTAPFAETDLSPEEIEVAVLAGLLRAVGRTRDGRVTKYELTHAGRVLLAQKAHPSHTR